MKWLRLAGVLCIIGLVPGVAALAIYNKADRNIERQGTTVEDVTKFRYKVGAESAYEFSLRDGSRCVAYAGEHITCQWKKKR